MRLTKEELAQVLRNFIDFYDDSVSDESVIRCSLCYRFQEKVVKSVTVPTLPSIDARILEEIDKPGNALDMGDYHSCETTHCRAGWAIHLCGRQGKKLEAMFGARLAGLLIYALSRPGEEPPYFYASEEAARADLQECAARPPRELPTKYADIKEAVLGVTY